MATATLTIQDLQEALSDPGAYPYDVREVEFRHTHISLVALAGDWVYKVKKPVDLGFLDFSTLERRHHFCKEEVRLNRRLCEPIYQGVVPLVERDGTLVVDGDRRRGTVVEYAVKMKRLDPDAFLDAQVWAGRTNVGDLDRVADRLCSFYEERASTPEIAEAGWVDRLRVSTDENFEQTRSQIGESISRPAYDALRYYTDRFYDQNEALLHRRRAGGFIVDGHGDLRLEHVHLTDERICIYDCIEFNERFRRLDVANDVAFLAMDLDLHGRPDLGRRLVDRVSHQLGDPHMTDLIDFYKSYRAYVRGKVEGMRFAEEEVPAAERGQSRTSALRHYQWALRYAVTGTEPLVVVVMGRAGTGKSTQAAAIAKSLGWAHLSSDRVRKSLADVSLHERADAATRERLYTREMSDATYQILQTRALHRARNHKGTVLDGTYSRRTMRERLRTTLRDANVARAFVELTAPDAVLRARLANRTQTAPTASDARAEDFDMLDERYDAPDALEDSRHIHIDTQDSPNETTLEILQTLIRLNN